MVNVSCVVVQTDLPLSTCLQRSSRRQLGRPTAATLSPPSRVCTLRTGSLVPEGEMQHTSHIQVVALHYPLTPLVFVGLCGRIICGLTQFTNKSHVAFAALEAVGFQTREVEGATFTQPHHVRCWYCCTCTCNQRCYTMT